MVACYIFPNIGRDDYNRKINEIIDLVRGRGKLLIVLGNLNAKLSLWEEVEQTLEGNIWGLSNNTERCYGK